MGKKTSKFSRKSQAGFGRKKYFQKRKFREIKRAMTSAIIKHISVMSEEVVRYVVQKPNGIYVDATFGGGGHSKQILNVLGEDGMLIAFDIDDEAVERGKILENSDSRFRIFKQNFANIKKWLFEHNINQIDGIVFDLGMSTFQIFSERGFSYKNGEAFLDMRMDQASEISAFDILNYGSRERLTKMFKKNADIHNSKKLVNNISIFRKQYGSINTVEDYLNIINASLGQEKNVMNFMSKCFQAVRIEVNDEIKSLESALDSLTKIVSKKGIVAIITFHSLEEEKINIWRRKNCGTIIVNDYCSDVENSFSLVSKGFVFPSNLEKSENWSSRSAKLWIFKKN